jgi:hypothetical protein
MFSRLQLFAILCGMPEVQQKSGALWRRNAE